MYLFDLTDRLDTTLVDFNDMRWERGDITFVFDGDAPPNKGLTVLDNKSHEFQRIRSEVRDTTLKWCQHSEKLFLYKMHL